MKKQQDPEAAETVQTTSDKAVDPAATCSAWRFKFSAQHPPESNMVGGTYIEGDLECEPEDLPEAAVAILKNAFEEWDTEGQTHISLNIEPNASVETSPKAK